MRSLLTALICLLVSQAAKALEVALPTPVTLTVVVDKVELVEELDGIAVGTDRTHLTRYAFLKPLNVTTNGVQLVGHLRFEAQVAQPTADMATADGAGKSFDDLTRKRQAFITRREALAKLRPALVAAKDKAERPASP